MTTNNKHPKAILLTTGEQEELRSLTSCSSSPMAFWLRAYRARGIEFRSKLPIAAPSSLPGEFHLEWTTRPLGPDAIRQGQQFRRFQEEKDQAFEAKMQRTGRGVW